MFPSSEWHPSWMPLHQTSWHYRSDHLHAYSGLSDAYNSCSLLSTPQLVVDNAMSVGLQGPMAMMLAELQHALSHKFAQEFRSGVLEAAVSAERGMSTAPDKPLLKKMTCLRPSDAMGWGSKDM